MSLIGEVGSVVSLIAQTASSIQRLGQKWYRASVEWEDFPGKVKSLTERHEFWVEKYKDFGLSSDPGLLNLLSRAKSLLEVLQAQEKNLLERKSKSSCTCWAGCSFKAREVLFPGEVGLSIQRVIDAYDAIPATLKREEEANALLANKQLYASMPKVVYSDKRYVHLEVSEREVQEALDNSDTDGPYVVLLHGGPGRGKSTLARHMEISYTLKERPSQASFDRVVLLECGPEVKEIKSFELKLVELSQQLVIGSEATNAPEEDRKFGEALKKRLVGFLREKKILLILDDVFEEKFLEMIVDLCGTHVKCLVTSQQATLCRNIANSSRIEIQEITQEVAKKILASHVGLDSQQIPEGLEEIANKIVEETDRNPLALASVATALAYNHSRDSDNWQRAYEDLNKLLASENTLQVCKRNYPQSFLSTMKLCVDSLNEKDEWQPAKKLLILAAICEGPSIPQVVIEVLWRRLGNLGSFIKLTNELENRKLITLRRESLTWDVIKQDLDLKEISWSMHSLQKRFIVEEMKADIISVVSLLNLETEPKMEGEIIKEEMPIILCALYLGDEVLVRRAASKMHISSENLKSMPMRRNAMEPILWLLGQPGSKPWRNSATQVFSRYICTGMLDDEAISHLLSDASVTPATLSALTRVGDAEGPYIDESKEGLMQALVGFLLAEEVDTNIKKEAIITLGMLSSSMHHKAFVVFFPGILEGLADLLEDSHPLLQEAATSAFVYLSYYRDLNDLVEMRNKTLAKIAKTHGVLDGLIKLLATDNIPILQTWAVRAIANLAWGNDEIKMEVVRCRGALDRLVLLLSKETPADLQKLGARAVANLARGNDEIQMEVVRCRGALDRLVLLLSKEETPADLREECARAVAELAAGNDEIQMEVVRCRGTLDGLVLLLSKEETPADLQKLCARALANLAAGNDEIQMEVVRCCGALDRLVQLLLKEETRVDLREGCAWAVANLAAGNDEIKMEVVRCCGALDGLVLLLLKEDTPADLRKGCAWAIANLAAGNDEIKMELVRCRGALDGLVLLLSKEETLVDLREVCAWAVANLAAGNDGIKMEVVRCRRALDGLVLLLSKETPADLREEGASAVANLASGNDEIKMEVVKCRGALDGLVLLLSKEETPADLREVCARAIANLAGGNDEVKMEVVKCRGALVGLVLLLPNPVVQEFSERALFLLASSDTIRMKMREMEGSMDGLTCLLVEQIAESSEEWAAGVLTLLDPVRGNGAHLHSGPAYSARGLAKLLLRLYVESSADLDKAHQLCPSDARTLGLRTFLKTKLGDFQAALEDANKYIELDDTAFGLQARGVLKRLMGDLDGALADFDEGLRLGPDDYETLKHRGFVKFMMKEEDGARADAECAMRVKPCRVDDPGYGRDFLGGISVEYLGYKLAKLASKFDSLYVRSMWTWSRFRLLDERSKGRMTNN